MNSRISMTCMTIVAMRVRSVITATARKNLDLNM